MQKETFDLNFHRIEVEKIIEKLKINLYGLSENEVKIRKLKYGKNTFNQMNKVGILKIFLLQFLNPLIFILIFASMITIYLKEIIETFVILFAILINVCFSAYQEYKAENTIEQLKSLIKNKAYVKRENKVTEIEAEELTVGDIVVLQYGSRIPADIRLIESNELKVDESILTGESLPVVKQIEVVDTDLVSERKNYVFSGTYITNGNGVGIVTHIGDNTEIGKIAKSITNTKKVLTPVQTAVKNISWYIFIIALLIVIFIFILGVYRGEDVFEMMVLASAVAVGAVPEALPIALTVILSIGVLNISKKGGLIRKLTAAETLGSTTLILTDKTGTLTEGNLKLENIISPNNLNKDSIFNENDLQDFEKQILILAKNNFSDNSNNAFESIINKIIYRQKLKNPLTSKIILPFNSTNKYSVSETEDKFIILGAPDKLILNSNLKESERKYYLEKINLLSSEGKRIVAIAEKNNSGKFELNNLKLIGLFVFSDILRPGIKSQIKEIIDKNIKVKILTGDLPGTAKYIGEQIGINASDEEILTGFEIENFNDDELLKIISKIKIFARVTPEDKLRIGKLYQQLGEIVAMTGDGVNDAPALKAMDIGISLSSGSEVAKSAADMILLKDNFKSIVDTISVGHNIKSNMQKVFVYLMSNSLDEVFIITGSLIAGLALPLTALQIIWVNILTGTLPALAFAYDKNKEIKNDKSLIFNKKVKFMSFGIGTLSSLLLFILYYLLVFFIENIESAKSIFFLCFSSYILIIAFSFKDLNKYIWQYNIFNNWRLNVGVVFGLILIFATVYTNLGQAIFKLEPIPTNYIWILFAWLIVNVWIVEFAKYVSKKTL